MLLSLSTRLCWIGQGKRLVIDAAATPRIAGKPDPKLIRLLVRAHGMKEKLRVSPGARIADLAMQEKLSLSSPIFSRLAWHSSAASARGGRSGLRSWVGAASSRI